MSRVRTVPLARRPSLVAAASLGRPVGAGMTVRRLVARLPDILAARDLRGAVERIAGALRRGRPVVLGMGAHPIKVGLGPVIVDLIERGRLPAVAMNGACLVHDFELAWNGRTSEDVGPGLERGTFGMARVAGGVYLNLGSAVVLPEVFVKALNLARNVGHPVRELTTIDMDFNRHYRPAVNVVARPTAAGGRGIQLTGHHEIMFPLLWAAVEHAAGALRRDCRRPAGRPGQRAALARRTPHRDPPHHSPDGGALLPLPAQRDVSRTRRVRAGRRRAGGGDTRREAWERGAGHAAARPAPGRARGARAPRPGDLRG